MSEVVLKDARGYPVIGIIGPRQSGKTTLVRELFPGLYYTNLENQDMQRYAIEDPRGFLTENKGGMIIDEFQRVPALLSYIQTQVDAVGTPCQFVLTGSQNFLMMEQISQSLAGRIGLFTLLPFSMNELYTVHTVPDKMNELLYQGFFPRIHNASLDPKRFFQNYVQTYVERDVRQLKNIGNLVAFQNFLKLCAGRTGQIVNLSSLGDDAGISHNTVKEWLSVLETSYIIHPLRPFYRNFHKQIVKSSKLYFLDTGLLCFLLGIEKPSEIDTHFLKGGIFENFVINEIIKYHLNMGTRPNLFFWRDRRGNEVDLLLESAGMRRAVEIKAGMTISVQFFSSLEYYGKLDETCDTENRYIIYGGESNQNRSAGKVRSWKNLVDIASLFD